MFSFFTKLFKEKSLKSGALIDRREAVESSRDYLLKEIVSTADPVNWIEKPQSSWRKFPIFNQNGSGSCVAQTCAKLLGINYWLKNNEYVHFSATDIYQRRSNKPSIGMYGQDALEILTKGVTLEVLVPSQNMTDDQMDSEEIETYKKQVGNIFKTDNYIIDPAGDIDTIASIIQKTGKGVMVWFYFTGSEWVNVPEIKTNNLSLNFGSTLRHSITAVDFTLYNGKKALIVEDSWGVDYGLGGQRIITEDFFKARNYWSAHLMNFVFGKPEVKKYNFEKMYSKGCRDAEYLQNFLKDQGTFPTNVESTGYYGSITADAVLEWQLNNVGKFVAIDPTWTKEELESLNGNYFGSISVKVANK
jgi:hypothetical protein